MPPYTSTTTPAQAVSGLFNSSADAATAAAVPGRWCEPLASSGAPTNLAATSTTGTSVRLCWGAPAGGGCVSEYRLVVRQIPLTDEEVASSRWAYSTLKTAG